MEHDIESISTASQLFHPQILRIGGRLQILSLYFFISKLKEWTVLYEASLVKVAGQASRKALKKRGTDPSPWLDCLGLT